MLIDTPYSTIKLLNSVRFFRSIPRYGYGKDISLSFFSFSFSNSEDLLNSHTTTENWDNKYTLGIVLLCGTMLILGLLWLLILLILRLLGRGIVGCASGTAIRIPLDESTISSSDLEDCNDRLLNSFDDTHTASNTKGEKLRNSSCDDNSQRNFTLLQKDRKRTKWIRILFFTSCVLTFISSGSAAYGIVQIQRAFHKLYETSLDLDDLVSELTKYIDDMKDSISYVEKYTNLITEELIDFCPLSTIKKSPTASPFNITDEVPSVLTDAVDDISEIQDKLSSSSLYLEEQGDIKSIRDRIYSIGTFFEMVESHTSWWFLASSFYIFSTFLGTLVLFIYGYCSVKAGFALDHQVDESNHKCCKFMHYVGIFFYALLALLAWVTASTLFAAVTANSDVCYSEISTGEEVNKILEQIGVESDLHQFMHGYLHECNERNSPVPHYLIETFERDLAAVDRAASEFLDFTSDTNLTEVVMTCGDDSNTKLVAMKDYATIAVEGIIDLLLSFDLIQSDILSCEAIAPLLQGIVYESACQSIHKNIVWNLASFLAMGFFMLLILTLRSVIEQSVIDKSQTCHTRDDIDSISSESYEIVPELTISGIASKNDSCEQDSN